MVPALPKLPAVVKLLLPARVKLPAAALVAKFANPLPVVWLMICEVAPLKVILAALVTILALLHSRVPETVYLPPSMWIRRSW